MADKPRSTVGTASSLLEMLYGSLSGLAFGLISPLASQPFDTMKTKMQADARFAGQSVFAVARNVVKADGALGLYSGILPILASTGLQKSVLFAANAGGRRACEQSGVPALTEPIPLSGGLRPAIVVGGAASALARTAVETPFELAKVRAQTGGSFVVASGSVLSVAQLAELYTGASATLGRATVMLVSFFAICDYAERAAPGIASQPLLGGFLKGGVGATAAWAIAWPLEVVKSKVQGAEATAAAAFRHRGTLAVLRQIWLAEGAAGLYRGFVPGAMRSFVANGAGMAVYQFTQSLRKD